MVKIYSLLDCNELYTAHELSVELGLSVRASRRFIKRMVNLGLMKLCKSK